MKDKYGEIKCDDYGHNCSELNPICGWCAEEYPDRAKECSEKVYGKEK